jgi:hypothetical protein
LEICITVWYQSAFHCCNGMSESGSLIKKRFINGAGSGEGILAVSLHGGCHPSRTAWERRGLMVRQETSN